MTDLVYADFDEGAGVGSVTAQTIDPGQPLVIDSGAASRITAGLFEGEDDLGAIPRSLSTIEDYLQASGLIGSKQTQFAVPDLSVEVRGAFESADVSTGDGDDRIDASASAAGYVALDGNGGDDTLIASQGGSQLAGRDGRDLLVGGDGDDWLIGGKGADTLVGGAGTDMASFAPQRHLVVDLSLDGVNTHGEGADTLIGIENIEGAFARIDRLYGNEADNRLSGGFGHNVLSGAGGDDRLAGMGKVDRLNGGEGADTLQAAGQRDVLTGGSGADVFLFTYVNREADHITDFEAGDVIDLSYIDADASTSQNDAFHLVAGSLAHAGDAVLEAHARHGYTLLLLNTDADRAPEEVIRIEGLPSAADLVL